MRNWCSICIHVKRAKGLDGHLHSYCAIKRESLPITPYYFEGKTLHWCKQWYIKEASGLPPMQIAAARYKHKELIKVFKEK